MSATIIEPAFARRQRSQLAVPASNPHFIDKAAQSAADVIFLDLENASQVLLRIEDAGVGFDPAQARLLPGHLGLTSMHERVEALGGTLTIDSHPGNGTRLQVVIALEQEVEHA